jgi:hypothetical protein
VRGTSEFDFFLLFGSLLEVVLIAVLLPRFEAAFQRLKSDLALRWLAIRRALQGRHARSLRRAPRICEGPRKSISIRQGISGRAGADAACAQRAVQRLM